MGEFTRLGCEEGSDEGIVVSAVQPFRATIGSIAWNESGGDKGVFMGLGCDDRSDEEI